jgi:hypothetical protein
MIDQARFDLIKQKHGHYASWAVWADGGKRPKDNIGDLSIFEDEANTGLLSQLNPSVVLVGLNISRGTVPFPLGNFHDGRSQSQDYKLRYALKDTSLWGGYITDIIKDCDEKAAGKTMAYLRGNKSCEQENVRMFREELRDRGADQPTIIAFGRDAFTLLVRNHGEQYDVWKLPHYSQYISKEKYREEVGAIIESKFSRPHTIV